MEPENHAYTEPEIINTSFHSYPKLYNIGHRAVKDLFLDEVLATEKIDGSQFSFGAFDGVIRARSRGKEIVIDAPDKMFIQAIETVKRLAPKLKDGWTYRGEYLKTPKHNVLAYDRIPEGHIILFDINTGHEEYLHYDEVVREGAMIGLEVVSLVFRGMVDDPQTILDLMERQSALGAVNIEGVAVKNYRRYGQDGKALMGKFVSEKFKEIHNKEWKNSNPSGKDFIGRIGDKYRTDARFDKAVQHLRDRGELQDDPRDIGKLIIEVRQDIWEECKDEIKDEIFVFAWKQIERRVVAGLPEWYKEQLLKLQFKQEDEVVEENPVTGND